VPLFQAALYRQGYKLALGADAKDVVPVIVLRHRATVLAMDDALWAKYPVARVANVKPSEANRKKDPFPAFNPYARPHTEAEKEYGEYLLEGAARRRGGGAGLQQRLPGLHLPPGQGGQGRPRRAPRRGARGLLRGVTLQPSGVYATLRAQEVGCTFMRS
jgi:hypothetical protein